MNSALGDTSPSNAIVQMPSLEFTSEWFDLEDEPHTGRSNGVSTSKTVARIQKTSQIDERTTNR